MARSAIFRGGAGAHRDLKKHADKYSCRESVNVTDEDLEQLDNSDLTVIDDFDE